MPQQNFQVNGQPVDVDAPDDMALLWVLRDKLGITGPKYGCGLDVCKACTCLVNGKAMSTCAVKIADVANKKVTTIEGLANGSTLHPVQQAWLDQATPQCGYCQSGQIMATVALLRQRPSPNAADIDAALSGNLCRCGTQQRIRASVQRAAQTLRGGQ